MLTITNPTSPKSLISPRSPKSPISPQSPISPRYDEFDFDTLKSVDPLLRNIGFDNLEQISETLQGSIWRGTQQSSSGDLISSAIKVTNKDLHQTCKGVSDFKVYTVSENILTEQAILKYLTQHKDCPHSIVKYRAFYESKQNYCFVMEDGGSSLFSFIRKVHQFIDQRKISISHWKQVMKVILKQMIECIAFIHSKNVCHFDISLENFLINDVQIDVHKIRDKHGKVTETITFVLDGIKVKLCDFGLARLFATKQCKSARFCGKTGYKSPEIFDENICSFDAKKNDIWGFGVCLYMMSFGQSPWRKANKSDELFAFAMEYGIAKALEQHNDLHYVDVEVLYLLHCIFQYESNRISLHRIQEFVDQYM
eukprot:219823_1